MPELPVERPIVYYAETCVCGASFAMSGPEWSYSGRDLELWQDRHSRVCEAMKTMCEPRWIREAQAVAAEEERKAKQREANARSVARKNGAA